VHPDRDRRPGSWQEEEGKRDKRDRE